MTAPASLPALIAEGRRLIAEATDRKAKGFPSPLPWYVSGCHNMIWGDDGDAITGPEPYFERPVANLIVFAVNNLAALLDVAEAGDALLGYHDRCGVASGYGDALRSALSRLRGVRS